MSLTWAWEHLLADRLWALIHHLPETSAFHRRIGTSSPLEENVATILDLVVNGRIAEYAQATFNPERWPEHAARARDEKRNSTPPAPLPEVKAVAVRPAGWPSLTQRLFTPPPPVDIDGAEALVALDRLAPPEPLP